MSLYIRSPIVKIVLGIVSVIATVAILLVIGVTEEARMLLQTNNWQGRSIETGAVLFANNCSSCHGADGKGLTGVGPAMQSHYFFAHRLEDVGWAGSMHDYVKLTVAAGRPSKRTTQWAQYMPTWSRNFGGPLREDQVVALADFVLNWEEAARAQSAAEDPWQPFLDVAKPAAAQTVGDLQPGAETVAEPSALRAPQALFSAMGCIGCHNLNADQTPQNRGPVGPHLGNLHLRAVDAVPGQDAYAYVYTSIVDPNAHIVEGYSAGIMLPDLATRMSEEEIEGLVQWLLDPNRVQ